MRLNILYTVSYLPDLILYKEYFQSSKYILQISYAKFLDYLEKFDSV